MSASYPKTTDRKKFNPHPTHHPLPAKFSTSVKNLLSFFLLLIWLIIFRSPCLSVSSWLTGATIIKYLHKVLSRIIILTTIIIIKRISTAPICRTRWEHRVLYNNTHARTHTHTHTQHTHATEHNNTYTTEHNNTHSTLARGLGGIGSAVKNKNGLFHGNNGNTSHVPYVCIYMYTSFISFSSGVSHHIHSFCVVLSHIVKHNILSNNNNKKFTSQYKRPQNTYCITP